MKSEFYNEYLNQTSKKNFTCLGKIFTLKL